MRLLDTWFCSKTECQSDKDVSKMFCQEICAFHFFIRTSKFLVEVGYSNFRELLAS